MAMSDTPRGRWTARIAAALTVLAALAWAQPASGATYYVRTSGSDSNDGLSPTDALQTISAASPLVQAGDTVYVGAGTYSEQVDIIGTDGDPGATISFVADTNGFKTGDAGDVVVSGSSSRDHGFKIENSDYIRIEGFHVTGAVKIGIKTKDSDRIIIKRCRFYNNHDEGIKLDHGAWATVEACYAYDNGKEGIHGHDADDLLIKNCVVYGNQHEGIRAHGKRIIVSGCTAYSNVNEGIELDDKSDGGTTTANVADVLACIAYSNAKAGIKVKGKKLSVVNCISYDNTEEGIYADKCDEVGLYNNTCVGNQEDGIHVKESAATLRNNILALNSQYGIYFETGRGGGTVDGDYNLLWQNSDGDYENTSAGPHDLEADPLFKDLAGDNYRVAFGSPAVNEGDSSTAPATDYEGQSRDASPDIGADELGRLVRIVRWRDVER